MYPHNINMFPHNINNTHPHPPYSNLWINPHPAQWAIALPMEMSKVHCSSI